MSVKRIGKYELTRTIGTGAFSKVKLAVDTQGRRCAAKVIAKSSLGKEKMFDAVKREIAILRNLDHPTVIKVYEVMQTPNNIYIFMELATGGELFDRIVSVRRFSESQTRFFFQQLIVGVHYCHSKGVVHRDLKPENLLVDEEDRIKITDFGLANYVHPSGALLATVCGTPNYVAPEVLRGKGYAGPPADVWSCGIILYVMLAGHLPFEDDDLPRLFAKIEKGEFGLSEHHPLPVQHLLRCVLVVDPARRFTIDQVITHPWVAVGFDMSLLSTSTRPAAKSDAAVFDPERSTMAAEEAETAPTTAAAAARTRAPMGAFEIISRLSLSTIASLASAKPAIRIHTRFVVCLSSADAKGKIHDVFLAARAAPQWETEMEGHGAQTRTKGPVEFTVCLIPLRALPPLALTIVEVRRTRGDTLDFQDLYRSAKGALGRYVVSRETAAA